MEYGKHSSTCIEKHPNCKCLTCIHDWSYPLCCVHEGVRFSPCPTRYCCDYLAEEDYEDYKGRIRRVIVLNSEENKRLFSEDYK